MCVPGCEQAVRRALSRRGFLQTTGAAAAFAASATAPAEVQAQAQGFTTLLQACLLAQRCVSYTLWGFTDRYNWVPGVFEGEGEATPLTADFERKPAYRSIRDTLLIAGR